jgi:hypothetical protein
MSPFLLIKLSNFNSQKGVPFHIFMLFVLKKETLSMPLPRAKSLFVSYLIRLPHRIEGASAWKFDSFALANFRNEVVKITA